MGQRELDFRAAEIFVPVRGKGAMTLLIWLEMRERYETEKEVAVDAECGRCASSWWQLSAEAQGLYEECESVYVFLLGPEDARFV
jgi:hypothetical protein